MLALARNQALAVRRADRPAFQVMAGGGEPHLPQLSWRWLIQIRLGDEAARQAFLEAWGPVVDQEVRRYAAKGGDAEELEAEGNLALWEGALEYDPQRLRTSPERYIANRIHKQVRRRYREQAGYHRPATEVGLELVDPPARLEERFGLAERRADLSAAVGGLAPAEQALFEGYLRLVDAGHGPDEAARLLAHQEGGSFAAWKKRLERARRKVRERML